MKKILSFIIVLLAVSQAYSQFIPIDSIRKQDVNGVPLLLNQTVWVRGVVTTSLEFGTPLVYFQDPTGGMVGYDAPFSAGVTRGDSVKVKGKVVQYAGLTEFTPVDSFTVLATGRTITPMIITCTQARDSGETYEGRLIKINNITMVKTTAGVPATQWTVSASGTNYRIFDGADSCEIRIYSTTNIANTIIPPYPFSVTALMSQYKTSAPYFGGYQILPRDLNDIARLPFYSWQSTIKCTDAGNANDSIIFGTAPTATNGLDPALGEAELPPVPPSSIIDYRFILPVTPSVASKKDYRNDTNQAITWRMTFQPSSGGYPMTFNWNPVALPSGSFFLKDEVTGTIVNVNMKSQSSYILTNAGITSLKVEYAQTLTVPVNVSNGWNMLSVPVLAPDMSVTSLFPDATSQAYSFNNGYVASPTLVNSKGYFLKFGNNYSYNIMGLNVTPKQIPVISGWNMIGPFETSIAVSSITSNPPGIVSSIYYGYNNGYISASSLDRGKGYWVKTTLAGTLILPSTADRIAENQSTQYNANKWTKIRITDKSGQSGTLFIAKGEEMTRNYELPPIPPQGIYDVRYQSDSYAEMMGRNHVIRISSAEYPIQITAENMNGLKLRVKDKISGEIVNKELAEGQAITVTQPIENLDILEEGILPTTYNIEQNYPNPFNPVTTIKYQIPQNGFVKIKIYDVLGKEVKTLVNQYQEAGYYSVKFDAGSLSSGIYFYRFESGNYTSIKKMMVIK